MASAGHVELSSHELETLAWEFLGSEFTTHVYVDWPIDRCMDAYLRHQGRTDVINDGAAYDALMDRVMANIAPAIRIGLLTLPRCRRRL
ncbi:MAG: hypothetical protein JO044_12765 [Mycobacteriaceae bacterium]|nr:hypothetical protein [Mycobacteriaceae bacterium]MBV9641605.1 hypothetical protein [Mycobacteriaceae bacterium]